MPNENRPFRCVVVAAGEPDDSGTFAMITWWDCDFDIVAAGIPLEDPAHALDTPLPGPGIWLWTGFMVGDMATEWRGSGAYRTLTEPEWAKVRRGMPPWDKAAETRALTVRDQLLRDHPGLEPQLRYGTGFFLEEVNDKLYLHWMDLKRIQVGTIDRDPAN